MLTLSDFTYQLPEALIAQTPLAQRDQSRLLTLNRLTGDLNHYHFSDLPILLKPSDVLVRNNTKVMPARLLGTKNTGGQVEILLVKKTHQNQTSETWECLTKPGLKPGQIVTFRASPLQAICTTISDYTREVEFNQTGFNFLQSLEIIGQTPLPPYIHWAPQDPQELKNRYQTTYARILGSVAAPTAGLHFTPEVDEVLRANGITILEVTLHVGLGTFLPVKIDDITQHQMHSEWYELPPDVAEKINAAQKAGRRVIAVGTTTCRVLESCATENHQLKAGTGETSIFIYPPYNFKVVNGLITNFHLPESTLLMLISALVSQPNTQEEFKSFSKSLVGRAYQVAIDQSYRFFSFGDAMLIL